MVFMNSVPEITREELENNHLDIVFYSASYNDLKIDGNDYHPIAYELGSGFTSTNDSAYTGRDRYVRCVR